MLDVDKPKIDVWVSTSVTPRPRDPADHPIQPCSKTKPTVDVSGLGKSNISKHSQSFCVSSAPSHCSPSSCYLRASVLAM